MKHRALPTPEQFARAVLASARRIADVAHKAGFHEVSPWWWDTLTRWLTSLRRQLVLRVGRRGGKSSTLCLLAVAWLLEYPAAAIPLGEVGVVAIVSVDRREAEGRLRTISALLTALRIPHTRSGDAIDITGRPFRVQVFTATVGGVSGFTCVLAIGDELAKWKSAETNANNAAEVLASWRPTLATQPLGRLVLSSSPLSNLDEHAKAYDAGDNDYQLVARAATWESNPSITEEETHQLEPDSKLHDREFGANPSSAVSGAFIADQVRATQRPPKMTPQWLSRPVLGLDASGGRGDATVWAAGAWAVVDKDDNFSLTREVVHTDPGTSETFTSLLVVRDESGMPMRNPNFGRQHSALILHNWHALEGRFYETVRADQIARDVARTAKATGATRCYGDQYASLAQEALLRQVGVTFEEQTFTAPSKQAAVLRVREWLRQGQLILPRDAAGQKVVDELLSFEERITTAGNVVYAGRRTTHDDRVSVVLQFALADINGQLRGSPGYTSRARRVQNESSFIFG